MIIYIYTRINDIFGSSFGSGIASEKLHFLSCTGFLSCDHFAVIRSSVHRGQSPILLQFYEVVADGPTINRYYSIFKDI